MIFLEFNGLPGCGKTTASQALTRRLREAHVECLTYDEAHEKIPKNFFKALVYVFRRWDCKEFFQFCAISKCAVGSSCITQIKRIIVAEQICVNYRRRMAEKGLCIIDQGLLQAIASVLYTYEVKKKDKVLEYEKKVLSRYRPSLMIVNAVSTPEIAKERIRYRHFDHGSRLNDVNSDEELVKMLGRQSENIQLVRKIPQAEQYRSIEIDVNIAANENADKLMRWINSDASCERISEQNN